MAASKKAGSKGTGGSNKPSDLDGADYSTASYRPGYSLSKSLKDRSEDDLKRGFKTKG
jgi:hypothetical protein